MLFLSVILLSLVQHVFLQDQCFDGLTYCLNRDGSTKCTANTIARATFSASHHDEAEHFSFALSPYNTKKTENVTLSLGFKVKGKSYNFYCVSENGKLYTPTESGAPSTDFPCSWILDVTVNKRKAAPITNSTISIDLATINDNVPISISYNDIKAVVAPNLKELIIHRLSFLDCWQENRVSYIDDKEQNRIMIKKVDDKEVQVFIYSLIPDQKSTDRSIKFMNKDKISLVVSCNGSFDRLTGYIRRANTKEQINDQFTFKSLNGYRCGFKLPLLLQTDSVKFDFNLGPLDLRFDSTSDSYIHIPNLTFDSDEPTLDLSKIDWDTYNP